MNNYSAPSNKPEPSSKPPVLVRMFHSTSGRQGFDRPNNQTAYPLQAPIDPRFAMMINMQTQQAINTSGIPGSIPYPGPAYYGYSPYLYGFQQSYPPYLIKR